MEVLKITKQEKSKLLANKEKFNVAAYARVSTDSDDQINSFESQKLYYESKINKNNDWRLVNIYADYGISGTNIYKRENFLRMISDALVGKIDVILTKSISRFARNTVDTLKYVRLLKERNIAIIFEEEKINTLDNTGEFLITVLSSVAQQESFNISSHVKRGHEMLLKSGNVILGKRCYGYRFINKENRIEIIPEEAKIVKMIFNLFLEGKSIKEIKSELEKDKIPTYNNNQTWNIETIRRILTNEKYKGDLLQRKNITPNPLGKIKVNKGLADKYLIRNFHEPIIIPAAFDMVQKIINEKREKTCLYKTPKLSILSYRIKCGFCGSSNNKMTIRRSGTVSICRNRWKNGRNNCPDSRNMHIHKILKVICKGLNKATKSIIESNDQNLLYVKQIINKNNKIDDNELLGKIIKYIIVGGYDSYKRKLPYMIRIILFNNYPLEDYSIKKISKEEILNIKTSIITSSWISQKIITYSPPGTHEKEITIPKVKVTVEVENGNN